LGGNIKKVHSTFLIWALTMFGLTVAVLALGGLREVQEPWGVMPEQGAMPPADAASGPRMRDVPLPETGPIIELLRPEIDKPISVPVEIEVRFIPRRAPVNVGSLKVTLVKFVNLEITDRVKPYTSSTGIHITNMKLPSGRHDLRITLADAEGNISHKQITLFIP
jgi:hypothetical protein